MSDQQIARRVIHLRQRVMQAFTKRWSRLRTRRAGLGTLITVTMIILFGLTASTIGYDSFDRRDQTGHEATNPFPESSSVPEKVSDLSMLPPFTPEIDTGELRRQLDLKTTIPDRPRMDVITYTVEQGDSLFGIADAFGLKPESLLWGNYVVLEDNPHSLRPGQELNILPIDGALYQWNEGDSLEAVAQFFGVSAQEIVDWPGNKITPGLTNVEDELGSGTWLVIPDGEREFTSWRAPRITRSNPAVAKLAGPGACGTIYDGPVGEGYFIWPTTANFLSGYSFSEFHPALDIAGSMGNAIYASASGVVVYAGWNNSGYGYMVVIDHGDGWQSLYAHMSQVTVTCGQPVFQGNVIGGIGSSGNSSGAHLHFEMMSDLFGRVDPYNFTSP